MPRTCRNTDAGRFFETRETMAPIDSLQTHARVRLSRIENAMKRPQSYANRRRLLHRLKKAKRFDDRAFDALERHVNRVFAQPEYRELKEAVDRMAMKGLIQ